MTSLTTAFWRRRENHREWSCRCTCTPGVPNGTTTEYEEGVEIDQTSLNGGGPYSMIGGVKSIDPLRLPAILKRLPACLSLELHPDETPSTGDPRGRRLHRVVRQACSLRCGFRPSSNAGNVDDYYSPEINSNVIACQE